MQQQTQHVHLKISVQYNRQTINPALISNQFATFAS